MVFWAHKHIVEERRRDCEKRIGSQSGGFKVWESSGRGRMDGGQVGVGESGMREVHLTAVEAGYIGKRGAIGDLEARSHVGRVGGCDGRQSPWVRILGRRRVMKTAAEDTGGAWTDTLACRYGEGMEEETHFP